MKNNKILALDTSTEACSAALFCGDTIIERYEVAPRKHTELILPMLQAVLVEGGVKLTDLDAIAFGCGPGSFTGIRIATSIVQALAFAYDLPVLAISDLRALAQGALREFKAETVLAVIDARMNEVYAGLYHMNHEDIMVAESAERVCTPEEIVGFAHEAEVIGVGSGWDSYAERMRVPKLKEWFPQRYPRAQDIAILAAVDYKQGKAVTAEQALPVYLRDEVVKDRPSP